MAWRVHFRAHVMMDARAASVSASRPPRPRQWDGLADMVNHVLRGEHADARVELARLQALAREVTLASAARHPELVVVSDLLEQLAEALLPHMEREESILYPYVVALEQEAAGGPPRTLPFVRAEASISVVRREHERTLIMCQAVRTSASDFRLPKDADDDYRAFYAGLAALEEGIVEHMRLESEELFERTIALEEELGRAHT
jgi:regulator of cell morphogenesis and NO signaling